MLRKKNNKKPAAKSAAGKRKDIRKIYKTNDGYFTGNDNIRKPRRVAVVEQRKDDGALAVVKIYSAKGKSGKMYVDGLTLSPDKHSSLTEPSVVGNKIHLGVKRENGYKAIYKSDFTSTEDKLTRRERRTVIRHAGGECKQHRKTAKKQIRKWKKHFRE